MAEQGRRSVGQGGTRPSLWQPGNSDERRRIHGECSQQRAANTSRHARTLVAVVQATRGVRHAVNQLHDVDLERRHEQERRSAQQEPWSCQRQAGGRHLRSVQQRGAWTSQRPCEHAVFHCCPGARIAHLPRHGPAAVLVLCRLQPERGPEAGAALGHLDACLDVHAGRGAAAGQLQGEAAGEKRERPSGGGLSLVVTARSPWQAVEGAAVNAGSPCKTDSQLTSSLSTAAEGLAQQVLKSAR